MELVGLEPTTRVLWNAGVSDQLTLSDTRHSSSKRAAIDGHFQQKGNLQLFAKSRPLRARGHDQAAVRPSREGGDAALDRTGVAHVDKEWSQFETGLWMLAHHAR